MKNQAVTILATITLLTPASISAEDWPHWRGVTRDDLSRETSYWTDKNWSPVERWRASVGIGSTSPLVSQGRLYTIGFQGNQDRVSCLDANSGKQLWQVSYPSREYGRHATGDQSFYSGVTSTPELDPTTGYLFTLSTDGELQCWNTNANGKKVWALNLYDKYQVPQRPKPGRTAVRDYGYTSSPLVLDDWLIVEVGGNTGTLIAFDKRSGQEGWRSQCNWPAGHNAGPVPMQVAGVRCVAVQTHQGLLVARTDRGHEGETVAQWPWVTNYANNIATAAVSGDSVLLTSGYNQARMVRLQITLNGARQVWESDEFSGVCTPLVYQGHVYWAWRTVNCLEFQTGKTKWQGGRVGDCASCIATDDGRLLIWAEKGRLLLVETAEHAPDRYVELASHTYFDQCEAWPHGVLADGRFYGKDRKGNLVCFDLSNQRSEQEPAPRTREMARGRSDQAEPVTSSAEDQPSVSTVLKASDIPWEKNQESIVFAWDRSFGAQIRGANNQPVGWRFQARGDAKGGAGGRIDVTSGAAVVSGANEALLQAFRGRDEFCLEAIFSAANDQQNGPARIISFSTDAYARNFTLGQEANTLVLRLRTTRTGLNGSQPEVRIGSVTPRVKQHLVVSYRNGRLLAYLDGKQVLDTTAVRGDFSNWSAQQLILGDEWDGGRNWDGTIERVAIYRQALNM